MKTYTLSVNNKTIKVEAEPETPMLWVLRDYVGLKGTKFGCGMGLCGACTIHVDGQAIRSCQTPISTVKASSKIITIEGVSEDSTPPKSIKWFKRHGLKSKCLNVAIVSQVR
jgi:isoquinoline 1-oxidoreductase alpha subunit